MSKTFSDTLRDLGEESAATGLDAFIADLSEKARGLQRAEEKCAQAQMDRSAEIQKRLALAEEMRAMRRSFMKAIHLALREDGEAFHAAIRGSGVYMPDTSDYDIRGDEELTEAEAKMVAEALADYLVYRAARSNGSG